jgi:hypothetical protein
MPTKPSFWVKMLESFFVWIYKIFSIYAVAPIHKQDVCVDTCQFLFQASLQISFVDPR